MLRVSYLEIYNEKIRDLLSSNPSHENLKVVEQDSVSPCRAIADLTHIFFY